MIPPMITVTAEEVVGSVAALHRAVTAGRPRQVRLILDSGAPVDQPDECGQTALIKAIFVENQRSRVKIVQILLRAGATVSRSDITGRNALSWAAYYGRDNVVELCIRHRDVDLDLNMSDINGCTPLFHAATSGSAACVKYIIDILLKYALGVDVPNFNGITPLMQALRLGHDVCASILIHQGNASTTVRDSNFLSTLDWAERVRGVASEHKSKAPKPEAFLPRIPQKSNFKPTVAPPSTGCARFRRRGGYSLSSSMSDEDSSYDSASESPYLDIPESDTRSKFSKSSRVTSPHVVFGRTPSPNITESGDETDLSGYYSDEYADSIPEKCPKSSQIQKSNHLPQLYNMLTTQLTEAYRGPGITFRSIDTPRPGSPELHDEDCPLECCMSSRSPSPAPSSTRSLPAIRVSEDRIKSMVRRSTTADLNPGKKANKGVTPLRKKLAQRQLANTLQRQSTISDLRPVGTEEKKSFPALPETGRISLVSSANFNRKNRTYKEE